MDHVTPPDGDPTFPTPPAGVLVRMAVETLVATLVCGLAVYGGYLALLWLQRLLGPLG